MTTKASVQKLARTRWKQSLVRENPGASTREEREADIARAREIRQRIAQIDEAIKDAAGRVGALVKAARFAIDVDGDEPSWSDLAKALAAVESDRALAAERREIDTERRALNVSSYRWSLTKSNEWCTSVILWTDTLEELESKIREKIAAFESASTTCTTA